MNKKWAITIPVAAFAIAAVVGTTATWGVLGKNYNPNIQIADAVRVHGMVPQLSIEEMAATSSAILEGTVSSIEDARWNTADGSEPEQIGGSDAIYHDVLVHVDKAIKGSLGDTVRVRVYEGEIPNGKKLKKLVSEGAPKFTNHEKVLLFLAYDDAAFNKEKSTDYYVVRGMFQGKWTLSNGKANNSQKMLDKTDLLNTIEQNKNKQWPKQQIDESKREK